MIRRLVEYEEVGIRNKLFSKHEFAELARTQIVAIEQFVRVGVQPRHDGEDAAFRLLVLVSEMPQCSLAFLWPDVLGNVRNFDIFRNRFDDASYHQALSRSVRTGQHHVIRWRDPELRHIYRELASRQSRCLQVRHAT